MWRSPTYLEIAREKQGESPSERTTAGPRPARGRRRHRLRLAVLDADRPPRARMPRLLRARAARTRPGRRSRSSSRAASSSPAAPPASTSRRAAHRRPGCSSRICRCSASATACSCWRTSSAARSRRRRSASTATPSSNQGDVESPLFAGLPPSMPVWMSHGDRITQLPPGFQSIAYSDNSPLAAMSNSAAHRRHPVPPGGRAHAARQADARELPVQDLRLPRRLDARQLHRRQHQPHPRAGRRRARDLRALRRRRLRGGGDAGARAIGDQLTCIFVDNGLMRREEPERVVDTFRRHMEMQLVHVDAAERFLDAAQGRHRSRSRSAASSARPSSASSRRRPTRSARSTSSRRARPTRTSSRARPDSGNDGEDQDAPQRRRPAEGDDVRADRAAALPVQGRGAAGRPRRSACPTRWSTASRSPAPASRSASSAR